MNSRELLRALRARRRARADRRDAARRRRRRHDRRGRGVRPRGSGRARLPREDGAQRVDVRPARSRVRLPLVRHALVPELRLRGGRKSRARCSIRALEPTDGLEVMRARRGVETERLLCAGPGRLCQALGVTREHDGLPLDEPPFELRARDGEPELVRGPRIGITKAAGAAVALRPRRLALPQPAVSAGERIRLKSASTTACVRCRAPAKRLRRVADAFAVADEHDLRIEASEASSAGRGGATDAQPSGRAARREVADGCRARRRRRDTRRSGHHNARSCHGGHVHDPDDLERCVDRDPALVDAEHRVAPRCPHSRGCAGRAAGSRRRARRVRRARSSASGQTPRRRARRDPRRRARAMFARHVPRRSSRSRRRSRRRSGTTVKRGRRRASPSCSPRRDAGARFCATTRPGLAVAEARHARDPSRRFAAFRALRELQPTTFGTTPCSRPRHDEHHAVVRRQPALLRVLREDDAEPLSRLRRLVDVRRRERRRHEPSATRA